MRIVAAGKRRQKAESDTRNASLVVQCRTGYRRPSFPLPAGTVRQQFLDVITSIRSWTVDRFRTL